jgi:pyruvate dehydrogenase E1 component alpha subunit/2-oxoisovalerate dehydrogenase E1 component alpha subunit
MTDEKDALLERELGAEIAGAISEVEALPPPGRATLVEDVYANLPWHLREQLEALLKAEPGAS